MVLYLAFRNSLFVHGVMPEQWTNKDISDQELQNILPFLDHKLKSVKGQDEKQLQNYPSFTPLCCNKAENLEKQEESSVHMDLVDVSALWQTLFLQ